MGRFVHPIPLPPGLAGHLAQRFPKTQRPIPNGHGWLLREPAAFEVEQESFPGLLAVALPEPYKCFIEFNFRYAKQYWGLEDFTNVTPTGVTNAANLSLFMVNVAYHLRADGHPRDSAYSVLDLKADCRGYKYVQETIKMLPEKPVVLENSNVAKLAISFAIFHPCGVFNR